MRTSTTLCSLCIAAALTFAHGRALAADPTESSVEANALTAKAGALYDEGVVAYKKGQWASARASFLAAWSLKKHWQIAGNLADCELQLGKLREAAEHAIYYLRNAPPDRRARAQALLDKAQVGTGTLTVTVDQPGADVVVDGEIVGKSPLPDPVFVDPGHHTVEARLGPRFAASPIDLIAGARRDLGLTLKGPEPVPLPERRSVVPGAVLGGVAGAALVTAIGLTVVASGKRTTARGLNQQIALATGSCVPGAGNLDARCSTLQSTSSTADTLGRTGVGLFVGAGAAALASTLYFVWPASKLRAPASDGFRFAPVVSTTGGAMVFSGAF